MCVCVGVWVCVCVCTHRRLGDILLSTSRTPVHVLFDGLCDVRELRLQLIRCRCREAVEGVVLEHPLLDLLEYTVLLELVAVTRITILGFHFDL